jgi:DNA-binding transcriptional ArsR family regulator
MKQGKGMAERNKEGSNSSVAKGNSKPRSADAEPGRFAYDGLHREFHEKARLGIMTSLLLHSDGLTFNDLKALCDLSDGNLNRHLEVLREAGFVDIDKQGSGRSSRSTCLITQQGREAFLAYLAELEKVVKDAKVLGNKKNVKAAETTKVGLSPS